MGDYFFNLKETLPETESSYFKLHQHFCNFLCQVSMCLKEALSVLISLDKRPCTNLHDYY